MSEKHESVDAITHPGLVRALKKSGVVIAQSLTPEQADLLHMAVGMAGESLELLEAVSSAPNGNLETVRGHITEELGDYEFYLEGLRQNLGEGREKFVARMRNTMGGVFIATENRAAGLAQALAVESGNTLDCVKKIAIYQAKAEALKKAMENLFASLVLIEHFLDLLRDAVSVPYEDCVRHNMAKLSVRYQGLKYSDKAAHERADKTHAASGERQADGAGQRGTPHPDPLPSEGRGEPEVNRPAGVTTSDFRDVPDHADGNGGEQGSGIGAVATPGKEAEHKPITAEGLAPEGSKAPAGNARKGKAGR